MVPDNGLRGSQVEPGSYQLAAKISRVPFSLLYASKYNVCLSKEMLGAASSSGEFIFSPRLTGEDQSVGPGPVLVDIHRSDLP